MVQFVDLSGSGMYFGFIELQEGVCYYVKVVEEVVKYCIVIDIYELVKDIGLCCMWFNWVLCEGVCGQEFNVWGDFINLVDYEVNFVFICMFSGLMDYIFGIVSLDGVCGCKLNLMQVKQFVFYVVLYLFVVMVFDFIEYYECWFQVFQFIKDVFIDWEVMKVV